MSFRESYNPFGGGGFTYLPPVIKSLLLINIGVFLLTFLFAGSFIQELILIYFALWDIPTGYFWPWQLVSYMFLHGGFMHIFFNMLALWMFGVELENYWGSNRFLTYYMVTGIGAGIIQLLVENTGAPTVGASGAVYGILLAFGMMFPDRIIFFNFLIPMKAKYFVAVFGAIELISGLSGASSGIAHFAHLGGMLWGFLLLRYWQKGGDLGLLWKKVVDGINQASEKKPGTQSGEGPKIFDFKSGTPQKPAPKANENGKSDAQRLDEILDKIADGGYASLTSEEKEFLFNYSRKR